MKNNELGREERRGEAVREGTLEEEAFMQKPD
jgi:hypothetical protein